MAYFEPDAFRAPVRWLGAFCLGLVCFGCKCSDLSQRGSERGVLVAVPSASAPRARIPPRPRFPKGPRFAILAGQGIGPVRFGATVATIERLMEHPCDVKTGSVCRYIDQAVEFFLKDGVVDEIYLHGLNRPAGNDAQGKPATYGVFNGAIPPDLMFGMLPFAIQEYLGKPARVEKLDESGPFRTSERHHYDGLVIEYDRHENGKLIVGGIKLEKSATPPPTPAASASGAVAG